MRTGTPAAAHRVTCWDSLCFRQEVVADVCGGSDGHGTAGRNQNAVPRAQRRVPCWAGERHLYSSKRGETGPGNKVWLEQEEASMSPLPVSHIPREKANGSMYVKKKR